MHVILFIPFILGGIKLVIMMVCLARVGSLFSLLINADLSSKHNILLIQKIDY